MILGTFIPTSMTSEFIKITYKKVNGVIYFQDYFINGYINKWTKSVYENWEDCKEDNLKNKWVLKIDFERAISLINNEIKRVQTNDTKGI